jgi:hypothetical protein
MNTDELDDLARRLAGAPMSRRATLKTAAAAAIMAPFLDIARRVPEGNARPAQEGAAPVCNWSSGAAVPCITAVAGTIASIGVCATAATVVTISACVAAIGGSIQEWDTCGSHLSCQCPAGTLLCENSVTDPDCCASDQVCVNVYGCMSPCDSCSTRNFWGECQSSCTNSQTCCNGLCLSSSDQCCSGPSGDFVCAATEVCCPGADPQCQPAGSLCCPTPNGTAVGCSPAGDYFCCGVGSSAPAGCCTVDDVCIYNANDGYYCCCPNDQDYGCASGVCVPA